ncbi:iron ABC transporter permease, partial [bacterium]|nr:iron ABC transporter permease [bacterium]
MRHFSAPSLIWALAILLPVAALVSITVGTVDISLLDGLAALTGSSINSQTHTILIDIRLPRILLAIAVGAVLASTGAVMQGLFRNPLADPSLIGVSSGASVGASLMIVTAGGFIKSGALLGLSLVAVGAFVGGFAATLLVYRLATSGIGTSVTTMLLAGIAIGALAGALNSLLTYFSDND